MKLTPQRIILTGGTNLNRDPKVIRPDQTALTKNAFPVIPGILSKRVGVQGIRLAVSLNAGAHECLPLDLVALPSTMPLQFAAHLHRRVASPTHALVASSFDSEVVIASGGNILFLGGYTPSYDPVRFVQCGRMVVALVPGVEGFYLLAPTDNLGQINLDSGVYSWYKASFNFTDGTQNQVLDIIPRVACLYKNRMVYGNFGATRGNWIIFADKSAAANAARYTNPTNPLIAVVGTDALAFNGRHLQLNDIDGEELTAMGEVSLQSTGAQIDSILVCLSERSCIFITGEILETWDTGGTSANAFFGDAQANKVNFECGCVSQSTFIKTPYGHMWAGPDDVWLLAGNTPVRIGTNIRPALQACPSAQRKYWSMAYANGVVVLQLVTSPATTLAKDSGSDVINTNIHQYWYLDLRDGAPQSAEGAKWYGPMEIASENGDTLIGGPITSLRDTDGVQRVVSMMYSQGVGLYLVDHLGGNGASDQPVNPIVTGEKWQALSTTNLGYIVRPSHDNVGGVAPQNTDRLHVCTTVGVTGAAEPAWTTADGGITNDGTVVWTEILEPTLGISVATSIGGQFQTDIRSRDNSQEDFTHEKLLRRVDINIAAKNKMALTVDVIPNSSLTGVANTSLGPVLVGGNELALGIGTIDARVGEMKGEARSLRPAETSLIRGRSFQLKLQDKTTYIIDSTNDSLNFGFYQPAGPSLFLAVKKILQITIAHGEYTSLSTILLAIVAKLNSYASLVPQLETNTLIVPASPWSATLGNFFHAYPYFNKIKLAYTTFTNAMADFLGIMMAETDAVRSLATDPFIIGDGATLAAGDASVLYTSRAKALANLLGLDTTSLSRGGSQFTGNTFSFEPLNATIAGADCFTSPIHLDGIQVTQIFNNANFSIVDLIALVQGKRANPLSLTTRD